MTNNMNNNHRSIFNNINNQIKMITIIKTTTITIIIAIITIIINIDMDMDMDIIKD